MDSRESPEEAVARELREESGYGGPVEFRHLATYYHPSGFQYYNYLAFVFDEFVPRMDWETSHFCWFDPMDRSKWPGPLHPGLQLLLSNDSIRDRLFQTLLNKRIS